MKQRAISRACVRSVATAVVISFLNPGFLPAQILLSVGPYAQDFNSLTTAASAPWVDNETLPGWYASKSVSPNPVTNCLAGAGASSTGGLYSFGEINSQERALGSLASGGTGKVAYGARFLNDTGDAQTGFEISCRGEQWRAGGPGAQKLSASFRVGTGLTNADARNDETWIPAPMLDFTGPITNAAQSLNGNDPANSVMLTGIPLPGIVLAPGQELFLRWLDTDDAGFDDGLAIDDFAVGFAPVEAKFDWAPPTGGFSLMTYNTHGNQITNWSTNSYQVRAIGRQLVYLQPDIITFNEIPDTNTYEMANWREAFLPGYFLATNSQSDGAIRNVIASRFPILSSRSWLHGDDLAPFGSPGLAFKRDLFEAEIAVPGFPRPLHVFCVHLKSGQDTAPSAERAAEAGAVSNFFATEYLPAHPLEPYTLSGDMNQDVARPPPSNPQTLQSLFSPATGLQLTSPVNPVTQSELTYSIQGSALSKRYDYILPCPILFSNISGSAVFRTDLLANPPAPLRATDDKTASDHLPVLMAFANPYRNPFRLISISFCEPSVQLGWESAPGQTYEIQGSADLKSWSALASGLLATSWTSEFQTNLAPQTRYLRVRREL